jgi:hypothetical protein
MDVGQLEDELIKLGRIPLIVDEVGYISMRGRSSRPILPVRLQPLRASQPHYPKIWSMTSAPLTSTGRISLR